MYRFFDEEINMSTVRLNDHCDLMFKTMKENYCRDTAKLVVEDFEDKASEVAQ